MSASLNTFAVVLLAFPFYLAQKGRLVQYVDFAKPSNANASTDKPVAQASMPSNTSPTSSTSLAALPSLISDAAELFT